MVEFERQNLPELLQAYYRLLFPHKLFHRWLSYGNVESDYFERREFSFTLSGDIYVRYQSFSDCNEMQKSILSRVPEKIDIGAVFNIKPKDSKNITLQVFKAEERELVFDIDMTDYDDVRTCCSGADICPNCWPFMIIAAKILNRTLRQDFGFRHLLWVYSGRRGIHCWVADQRARKLNGDCRSAIAEYLSVIEGGEFKAKKVVLNGNNGLHPMIKASLDTIKKHFKSLILDKQNIMGNEQQINKIIDLCSDPGLKKMLSQVLNEKSLHNSVERWEALVRVSQSYFKGVKYSSVKYKNRHFVEEVMIQLCYPRLDINVTKGVNHLLKTPFSVHPKTGRVCVPIDFDRIDDFDPFRVSNVSHLCKQIDEKISSDSIPSNAYELTDLKQSIYVFKNFINNLEKDFKGVLIAKSDQKMEF